MSSVTRSSTSASRRSARKYTSSPYSRQASKKSSWAWTDVFSYLNPLRALSSATDEDDVEQDIADGETNQPSSAARAMVIRGHEMLNGTTNMSPLSRIVEQRSPPDIAGETNNTQNQQAFGGQAQPDIQNPASLLDRMALQGSNNKTVEEFLRGKGDEPLTPIELAGVMALLGKPAVEADRNEQTEPFRFSTSSKSPEPAHVTFTTGSASNGSRKMLSKNPNGPYIMRGGGSARPRNRYQSPGFGPQPRASPAIKLAPPMEGKRRRIGFDPEASRAQRVPASSSPSMNGHAAAAIARSAPTVNGGPVTNGDPKSNEMPPSTPVRRSSVLSSKPTTPVNPSPLRQTWSQSDSPPSQQSPPSTGKQTRSAAFLASLIQDISPKKKADVANPYQAASLIPPRPHAKKVLKKTDAAKVVPTQAPNSQATPTTKEPALTSVQELEITMPIGSKRARPPPDFKPAFTNGDANKPGSIVLPSAESGMSRKSMRLQAAEFPTSNGPNPARGKALSKPVETEVNEEQASPQKKQKTTTRSGPAANDGIRQQPPVSVQEVDDDGDSGRRPDYMLPSEVIEPDESSKHDRRSASPTSTTAPVPVISCTRGSSQRATFTGVKSSAPRAPSKLRHSMLPGEDEKEKEGAAPVSLAPPAAPVRPSSGFAMQSVVPKSKLALPKDAKTTAAAKNVDALPTYSFTVPPSSIRVSQKVKNKVAAIRPQELPTYHFLIPSSSPGAGPSTMRASVARVSSGLSLGATTDYSYGGTSSDAGGLPPSTGGFDWAAAGMTKPAEAVEGQWTCTTCMLKNDAMTTDKCAVCETPRSSVSKPQSGGFNWAAAGIAKPASSKEGSWTCSVCMLSSGPEATDKCTICDAPRR